MSDDTPTDDEPSGGRSPIARHLAESALGLAIALLLLWVAIAAVTDIPFVYQGL